MSTTEPADRPAKPQLTGCEANLKRYAPLHADDRPPLPRPACHRDRRPAAPFVGAMSESWSGREGAVDADRAGPWGTDRHGGGVPRFRREVGEAPAWEVTAYVVRREATAQACAEALQVRLLAGPHAGEGPTAARVARRSPPGRPARSPHTLAAGIDRDRAAVIAGLTLPWNSGVVEGHVNRIKMLKRQMFGRAGLALLRKRVLLAP
jgi:hypothetical protein